MSEDAHNSDFAGIPTMSLDDRGTRYQHYRELIDLWETGAEIIRKYGIAESSETKERLRKLDAAVFLVNTQIEKMSCYGGKRLSLAMEIDSIRPQKLLDTGKKSE